MPRRTVVRRGLRRPRAGTTANSAHAGRSVERVTVAEQGAVGNGQVGVAHDDVSTHTLAAGQLDAGHGARRTAPIRATGAS